MTLHHVVLFGLHDPSDAAEAVQRLRAMGGQIPSLLSIRAGAASNPGGDPAANLVLITEHEDEAGLAAYVNHPLHLALLEWLRPRIANRTVVDTPDLA